MTQPDDEDPSPDRSLARTTALRHVLQRPVHAMIGYAQVLLDDVAVTNEHDDRLHGIIREASALLTHLENLVAEDARADEGEDPLSTGPEAQRLHASVERIVGWVEQIRSRVGDASSAVEKLSTAVATCQDLLAALADETSRRALLPETLVDAVDRVFHTSQRAGREREATPRGTILVVDDVESMRDVVSHYLKGRGHRVITAAGGHDALKTLQALAFDVVILDLLMPDMDGYETLTRIRDQTALEDLHVVMLSSIEHVQSIAHCISLGADDFLAKPFEPSLLIARVDFAVQWRHTRERERSVQDQLANEQARSHDLLLNILPATIAKRLQYGQKMIANQFESATVLFGDMVNFTRYASSVEAADLVRELNRVFHAFDELAVEHGVEKIKTIGDAYLAVAGVPDICEDHAERAARLALSMLSAANELRSRGELNLEVRFGLHSGPITAGVIGKLKFAYDIWGDTVNVASRMESTGSPGAIQISSTTRELLGDRFVTRARDQAVSGKGKGLMSTWLLEAETPPR